MWIVSTMCSYCMPLSSPWNNWYYSICTVWVTGIHQCNQQLAYSSLSTPCMPTADIVASCMGPTACIAAACRPANCKGCTARLPCQATAAAYQVVHNMCLNVVVDLVEDAVVAVQCGQTSTQIAPLLTPGYTWTAQQGMLSAICLAATMYTKDCTQRLHPNEYGQRQGWGPHHAPTGPLRH